MLFILKPVVLGFFMLIINKMIYFFRLTQILYLNRFIVYLLFIFNLLFFVTSCALIKKSDVVINSDPLTGKKVYFSKLDKSYRGTKNFSKQWSKIFSKKSRSYHKFLDKEYFIKGHITSMNKAFLVINSKRNKLYKTLIKLDKEGNIILPKYMYFEDDLKRAEALIGKSIWLNYVNNKSIFFSYSNNKFQRFNKVKVIGVNNLTNNSFDLPIWLIIKSEKGHEGFLRYSKTKDNVGLEDNYYLDDPFPKEWSKNRIKQILKGEIELGMNKSQIRRSIGNPDIINRTSSRHGLSEQWLYKKPNSNSISYQFEYGKLVYVSN